MTAQEKFQGFTYQENKAYQKEAEDLYGKEVVEASIQRLKGKEQALTDGFNRIFFAFADNMQANMPADDPANIHLAKDLHQHICEYSFDCSLQVFSSIAYGYVQNPAFTKNIDQFGQGTSQYICDAAQAYVNSQA